MNFTNKWPDYRDILLACWWTPGYWQHISSLPGLQFYKDARTASHFCCLKQFLFLGLNPAIPGFDSAAVNLSHNVTAFYPSLPMFDHWKQQTYLSRNAHPVGWFRTGEPWSTKGGVVALHICKHSKIHPQHRHGIAAASLPGGTQARHAHLLCHKLQLFTTQQPFPATNTFSLAPEHFWAQLYTKCLSCPPIQPKRSNKGSPRDLHLQALQWGFGRAKPTKSSVLTTIQWGSPSVTAYFRALIRKHILIPSEYLIILMH